MWFLDQIVSTLGTASGWFYSLYRDFSDVPLIGRVLAAPFYWLYGAFYYLAIYFSSFNAWVEDATSKLGRILSLADITGYLRAWLDYAANAWAWVSTAVNNVLHIVDAWWQSVKPVVLAWIQEVKYWVSVQLRELNAWLDNLQMAVDAFLDKLPALSEIIAWFGNWWGNILSLLGAWWAERLGDIRDLFMSWAKDMAPFWAGWQDIRDQVFGFFNDPIEYLWSRFTDWFLGPEG